MLNTSMKKLGSGAHGLGRVFIASLLLVSTTFAQSGTYDWGGVSNLGSYQGIKWVNVSVTSPRNMNINVLQIDTITPGLEFYTTARSGTLETMTQTTRQFIEESQSTNHKLVAAINADFFDPFHFNMWNPYATNLLGFAVSEGTLVSSGAGAPSFVVDTTGNSSIVTTFSSTDTSNIRTAVSGGSYVLNNGTPTTGDTSLQPRTGIGVSQDSRYVYFMTIDGRQPASSGATTDEVGSYLKWFGAYTGINMDGGGSTTMAWWNSETEISELLNHPRAAGLNTVYTTERYNGNNIGIYYTVVPEPSASALACLGMICLIAWWRRKKLTT